MNWQKNQKKSIWLLITGKLLLTRNPSIAFSATVLWNQEMGSHYESAYTITASKGIIF